MLFNSFEFIFLFLPITLILYFLLNHYGKYKLAKGWLIVASLYFYAYFNYSYLILIITSILANYFLGDLLHSNKRSELQRKGILGIGIIFNLGALGYFKYFDFFVENINIIFKTNIELLKLMLPLGISFFTFQQLSFVVDSYKKKSLKYDFLSYCLFVTFFPQLIAGPIVFPTEMLPQFEDKKNKVVNYENLNRGLYLFSIGLAKKVLIADSIAPFADTGFDKMASLTFMEAWLTSISYTMQLYFDFSGYCDMAMGIALMFNIVLPLNFNSPYKSINIQDFWKKWHITLGRFLTSYLYIPLGGNRNGEIKTLRNLLVVFLASGIWHGAGWNFIIWGGLHGTSILIHRLWKKIGLRMPKIVGWGITMFLINIFWIFFRATSVDRAIKVIKGMLDLKSFEKFLTLPYRELTNSYLGNKLSLAFLFIGILLALFSKNSIIKNKNVRFNISYFFEQIIYLGCSMLLINRVATFLYFNF